MLGRGFRVTRETNSKILNRLEEWKQREGQLPVFVKLYEQILRVQAGAKSGMAIPKVALAEEVITDRIGRGVPLLTFDDLSLDWSLLQNLFQAVTTVIVEADEAVSREEESLREVAFSLSLLQQATKAWFEGLPLSPSVAALGVNEELLTLIIRATLRPFLAIHAEALLTLVNQESWRRRYCPICGGKPDFAFLDKERGARWLLCSRCDASWLFQRLECPYCGTQNQDALAYLTDDTGLYRLYVCEQCRSYLKTINLRQTESDILLPLERILTVDLDRQALESGYKAF